MGLQKEKALGDPTHQEPSNSMLLQHFNSKPLNFSFFSSVFENKPKPFQIIWPALRLALNNRALKPSNPKDKRTGPCISAATFDEGKTRSTKHVVCLSALILDLDNKGPVLAGFQELKPLIDGLDCVLYTTWSHNKESPRYRLIFPLMRKVWPNEWERFVMGFLRKQGLDRLGLVDVPAALDTARLNLLPLEREGVKPQTWILDGAWVDPDLFMLPLQPAKKLKPKSRSRWAKRTHFDLRTLRLADLLHDSGLKTKETSPYQGARRWRTSCPWYTEHSDQKDSLDAVILHDEGRHWPSWVCSHAHCNGRGLQEILRWCGVELCQI